MRQGGTLGFYTRVITGLMAAVVLAVGCVPNLMSLSEGSPAQVLSYPGAPPVIDGRTRFRQVVCSLAGQSTLAAGSHFDCANLLWRMADEEGPTHKPTPLPSHDPRLRILIAEDFAGTYRRVFSQMPLMYCHPGDLDVVSSLTRSYCMIWLASHRLPEYVKYFSLGGFGRREAIHPMMLLTYDLLSTVEPRNDGYVVFSDQVIPGASLLGYANLDHWDIALPVRERLNFGEINSFAVARELLFEAIVLTVAESLNSVSISPAL